MTAIRVIFDGKTFVPQQPVSLPEHSEGLVIVEQNDPARVRSPRLAHPEQSKDFTKQIVELAPDAKL